MNAVVRSEPATELATLTQIAEYNQTASALADLRARYAGAVYDVKSSGGMKLAVAARAELRDLRVNLENKRVEIKAPALKRCQLIDTEAKRLTTELRTLEDPIDLQIQAEVQRKEDERKAREEAERKRIAAMNVDIDFIRAAPVRMVGKSAVDINDEIAVLEADALARFASDPTFAPIAERSKEEALSALRRMHAERVQLDAERVELERQREEQERINAQAAEQLRIEAAAAQVERDRLNAEAAEKLAQQQREADERLAEAERLETIAREEIATARRAQQEREDAERAERQRVEDEARAKEDAARAERQRQEDAERSEQIRKFREEQAEAKRKADEAAAIAEREREQREAEALANVTLHDAAQSAHDFLVAEGFEHAQPTRMLASALARTAVQS